MVNGMFLARHLSSFSQLLSATGVEVEARKRGGGLISYVVSSNKPSAKPYFVL